MAKKKIDNQENYDQINSVIDATASLAKALIPFGIGMKNKIKNKPAKIEKKIEAIKKAPAVKKTKVAKEKRVATQLSLDLKMPSVATTAKDLKPTGTI